MEETFEFHSRLIQDRNALMVQFDCNGNEINNIDENTTTDTTTKEFTNTNLPLYNFLLNKWFIDELYESIFVKPIKKIGAFFWKTGDQKIIDRFGPDGISKIIKMISNKAGQFQTGYIYDYAFVMLIGLSILLTYLILR